MIVTRSARIPALDFFKQFSKKGLRRVLQRLGGASLETKASLALLRNLAHGARERRLPDEKLGGLLELPDFAQRHCARAKWCGFLFSTAGGAFRAAFVASYLRRAFPPVDIFPTCLVRAMLVKENRRKK